MSKDGEQLEKRTAFNRASKLPPVVPFTLYCPVCSLPVGRDEVVVGQGDGSVAGFWDAICPTCALRP